MHCQSSLCLQESPHQVELHCIVSQLAKCQEINDICLTRYKNEPRQTLSLDQVNSVLAPSAISQTNFPANVVNFISARDNPSGYYTSNAVRFADMILLYYFVLCTDVNLILIVE